MEQEKALQEAKDRVAKSYGRDNFISLLNEGDGKVNDAIFNEVFANYIELSSSSGERQDGEFFTEEEEINAVNSFSKKEGRMDFLSGYQVAKEKALKIISSLKQQSTYPSTKQFELPSEKEFDEWIDENVIQLSDGRIKISKRAKITDWLRSPTSSDPTKDKELFSEELIRKGFEHKKAEILDSKTHYQAWMICCAWLKEVLTGRSI